MTCRNSGYICSTRGLCTSMVYRARSLRDACIPCPSGSSKGRWLLLNVRMRLSMLRSNACGKGLPCVVSSGRSQSCPVCAWGLIALGYDCWHLLHRLQDFSPHAAQSAVMHECMNAWCIVRAACRTRASPAIRPACPTGSSGGCWLLLNGRSSTMHSALGLHLLWQGIAICCWQRQESAVPCLQTRVIVLGYDCWHLLRRLAGPQHSWVSVRAHYPHALHMHGVPGPTTTPAPTTAAAAAAAARSLCGLGRASHVDNRSVRRELAGCGVRVWMLGL
jgi:hypothetical protein